MPDKPNLATVQLAVWSQDHLCRLLEVPGLKLLGVERELIFNPTRLGLTVQVPDCSMSELGGLMLEWRSP
jgi:hypothetical protein